MDSAAQWWIDRVPFIELYMRHHPYCKAITLEDFEACTCGLVNVLWPMLEKRRKVKHANQ
jgi:hypothetical protein